MNRKTKLLAAGTVGAALALVVMAGEARAQKAMFESDLYPTDLGAAPAISGVPAHPFAWDLDTGQATINDLGDIKVDVDGLLIAGTDGAEPGAVNTNGGVDMFASLACGNTVVASTAPVTPTAFGELVIQEPGFLAANGVADCAGAQILLRAESDAVVEMYAAVGGGFVFRVAVIDQDDATTTILSSTFHTNGLTGIAFDASGRLFGTSNRFNGSTPELLELDPETGETVATIAVLETLIRDLAVQPGTNILFGTARAFTRSVDSFSSGTLVTIDKANGALTVVGDNGIFGGGLAFAPNGTLYRSGFEPLGGTDRFGRTLANRTLDVLDPATGAVISSVITFDPNFDNGDGTLGRDVFIDGLGVRPSDGKIFATPGGGRFVYTVDPATGILTKIGDTTNGELPSDLAFRGGTHPWVAASGFSVP